MRIINDNVVRGRLSENYLTQKFIAQNICNAKYYGNHCCTHWNQEWVFENSPPQRSDFLSVIFVSCVCG